MAELSTELAGERWREDTSDLTVQAKSFTIADNEGYARVCEFEKGLKALDRRIIEHHATRKRLADQLHKRLVAEEREDRAPIQAALSYVRPKRIAWEEGRERDRQAEEARQREAQRKLDEERRLAEAEKLEAAGHAEEAERVLEREEPQTRVSVVSDLPKSGIAKREYWGFHKVNLLELVKAAAEDPDRWLAYLDYNDKTIRDQVTSLKSMCKIPGIAVWSERR